MNEYFYKVNLLDYLLYLKKCPKFAAEAGLYIEQHVAAIELHQLKHT